MIAPPAVVRIRSCLKVRNVLDGPGRFRSHIWFFDPVVLMKLKYLLPSVLPVVLFLLPEIAAHGQERIAPAPPTGRAFRTARPPVIDGLLDDEPWLEAMPIGDFVQHEPFEGQAASERTEVRLLYDDRSLYVGVMCFDTEPARILVSEGRRDSELGETDSFWMIFDTYRDRQNGFVFGTTPAGIEYDGQVTRQGEGTGGGGGPGAAGSSSQGGSGGGFNKNWDGQWTVRTRTGQEGWAAEFQIPLTTLRFKAGTEQTWGANFARNIRRKNEQVYWAPVPREYTLYRLSLAGEIEGLDLKTPRNLKLVPYVVGSAGRDYEAERDGDTRWLADAGFDVKYGLTPSMTLDLTYNTDFAQVEVDEQQVNLSRFNLFFPEKRPFFLENAGFFSVGDPQQTELFFSRRIGIDDDGSVVPIVGGARMSGSAGRWNLGFLDMQTGEAGSQPGANFAVFRPSRQFGNRSSLGAILVNKEIDGAGSNYNRTFGADGRLGLGESFLARGFLAGTATSHPGEVKPRDGQYAASIAASYRAKTVGLDMGYREVGENFNPETGFLSRNAYRSLDGSIHTYLRFPSVKWLRELRPHASFVTYWSLDGFKETERIHLDNHTEWQNGSQLSTAVNILYEGLLTPFEIYPGIWVPPGRYRSAQLAPRYNSNLSAPVSFDLGLDAGGFYSGHIRTYAATSYFRKGSHFSASLRFVRNEVELPVEGPEGQFGGDFTTNRIAARVNYSFTPRIFLQSLLQYNDRGDNWSTNLRFGWLSAGGAGLFLVYRETRDLEGIDIGLRESLAGGPLNRALYLKLSREFQLF